MSQVEIDILTKWVKMGAPWPTEPEVAVEISQTF